MNYLLKSLTSLKILCIAAILFSASAYADNCPNSILTPNQEGQYVTSNGWQISSSDQPLRGGKLYLTLDQFLKATIYNTPGSPTVLCTYNAKQEMWPELSNGPISNPFLVTLAPPTLSQASPSSLFSSLWTAGNPSDG